MHPARFHLLTHAAVPESHESKFFRAVHAWMCAGLLLTAAGAVYMAYSRTLWRIASDSPAVFAFLVIAELVLVAAVGDEAVRLRPAEAVIVFVTGSIVTGVALGGFAIAYAGATIVPAFVATAAMFGLMSLADLALHRDVASAGTLTALAVAGAILNVAINVSFNTGALGIGINIAGVVVFATLAIHEEKKLRSTELAPSAGALAFYVDFLNLFVLLYRALTRRTSQ